MTLGIKTALSAMCLTLAAGGLMADTLVRKDGRVYEGEVVSQTRAYVQFKTRLVGSSGWTVLPVPTSDVLRIDVEPGDQTAAPSPPAGDDSASGGQGSGATHRTEEVLARGSGATEREATDAALRAAVEQVVGTLITGKTQVANMRMVEDSVIAHANGFVRSYSVVGAPRNTGSPGDPHVEVRILAEVEITKIYEQFKADKIEFREGFDADSIYARVITKEARDQAAAATLSEVFADYPNRVWTVKPVGKVREAGLTESGEVILAAKVRFAKTRGQWAAFAGDLKRVLGKVGTSKQRIRTDRTQYSLAAPEAADVVGQLDIPWEVREENELKDSWGLVSIPDHDRIASLRECWPLLDRHTDPLWDDGQVGFEDMVVLVDRKLRSADAWAVPEEAWDEVAAALRRPPEVYVSLMNESGEEIGRPLFGRDQQCLSGKAWGAAGLHPDAFPRQDMKSPRRCVLSPWAQIDFGSGIWFRQGSTWPNSADSWAVPTVDIEYRFAVPKEELQGTPLIRVELVQVQGSP